MIPRNLNLRIILRRTQCSRLIATSTKSSSVTASLKQNSKVTSEVPMPGVTDAKINNLVGEISSLTLLQAAELVAALKSHLNIQEVAVPVMGSAPAPAPAETEKPEVEEKPKEKTSFTVKLESFDPTVKPKIIREIKSIMPNMKLMEAKTFVESAPQTIKENLSKEDAEKLKATFEALGAKIVLE